MAAVIGGLVLLGGEAVRRVGEDLLASRLRHDAESVLAALRLSPSGEIEVQTPRLGAIYDRPFTGHYFLVTSPEGDVSLRSRSLWDAPLPVPPLRAADQRRWHADGPDGQPLLVWAGGYRKLGRTVTIAVAEDLGSLHAHLATVRWALGGLGLLVLAGVLGLQRMILFRALAPLQGTATQVDRLAAGEIAQLDESGPAEVRPLVREINRLLALLERRLQRSRSAAGNLAHALKAPLALLQQLSDSKELGAHPHIAAELGERVTQIQRAIDSELRRARLAGAAGRVQAFRPAQDLPQLVEVLRRIYAERDLTIKVEYPQDRVLPLDRDDALELIGNLMDNACKWGNSRVRLTLGQPGRDCLTVEDDGPGCEPERIAELARRGKRLDEAVAGHGLGLSIVHEITKLYDASLVFDRSTEWGGLRVRVCFPPFIDPDTSS